MNTEKVMGLMLKVKENGMSPRNILKSLATECEIGEGDLVTYDLSTFDCDDSRKDWALAISMFGQVSVLSCIIALEGYFMRETAKA